MNFCNIRVTIETIKIFLIIFQANGHFLIWYYIHIPRNKSEVEMVMSKTLVFSLGFLIFTTGKNRNYYTYEENGSIIFMVGINLCL